MAAHGIVPHGEFEIPRFVPTHDWFFLVELFNTYHTLGGDKEQFLIWFVGDCDNCILEYACLLYKTRISLVSSPLSPNILNSPTLYNINKPQSTNMTSLPREVPASLQQHRNFPNIVSAYNICLDSEYSDLCHGEVPESRFHHWYRTKFDQWVRGYLTLLF